MRVSGLRAAALAAIIVPVATSCASKPFPASPVPSALTERQADRLARAKLYERDAAAPRIIKSIDKTGCGYLIAYVDDFGAAGKPPMPSRLVQVRYDGTVRELPFERGK